MGGHIGFRSRLFEAHVQGKRDNNLLEAQMRKLEKEHRERLEVIRRSAGKAEATLPGIRRLSSKAQKLSEQ
ncbi:unnamed protein product [Dibothriocephalus latus]|uniref:Uncharacterized protein n=1 Tax=Dibothriocephalus latus TaxID=60516 RepID=A0A3P7Q9X5_DIBLA|nr:unnamed protein product [Dibothriocephalus latus]